MCGLGRPGRSKRASEQAFPAGGENGHRGDFSWKPGGFSNVGSSSKVEKMEGPSEEKN